MGNYFLKVNKDLFKLGLNSTEILVLAQVMEFQANTNDCFISDKALAENFGVSEKTISRTLKALEDRGFIVRDTKSVKGGKVRHMKVNLDKLQPTTDNLTVDSDLQQTNCPLTTDNLTFDNRQNDLIKDNLKNKEKDNIKVDISAIGCASAESINSAKPIDEKQAELLTKSEAMKKYGVSACVNMIKTAMPNCYWISGNLVKII